MSNISGISEANYPEPIILVMGQTGAGTSTFIKSLLSSEDKPKIRIGHGCLSCTQTSTCWPITLGHRTVQLIETPGLNNTNFPDSSLLLNLIADISACSTPNIRIKGIIFLIDITSKIGSHTLHHLRLLDALAGREAYKNIIFVTTKWMAQDTPEEKGWKLRGQDGLMTDVLYGFLRGKAELHTFSGGTDSARTIVSSLFGKSDVWFQVEREVREDDLRVWESMAVQVLRSAGAQFHQEEARLIGVTMREMRAKRKLIRGLGGDIVVEERKKDAVGGIGISNVGQMRIWGSSLDHTARGQKFPATSRDFVNQQKNTTTTATMTARNRAYPKDKPVAG